MIPDYARNLALAQLRWGVFSLDDHLDQWQAAIMNAVDDRDGVSIQHYLQPILHIVQLHCNGVEPNDYIDIHDLHWVNHVDVRNIIDALVASINHYTGLRRLVKIGLIQDTYDFIVECQ